MPLHKLRIEAAGLAAAQRAAERLAEPDAPEALAVTLFELVAPAFVVEAYYAAPPPPLDAMAALLAGQGAELGPPSLDEIAEANWVALSQAALPPVRAGRFVVHGSHDRARFAMRRGAIEIEAGEAFGTAHNATTVLCLEALDGLVRRRRFARVLDLGCGTGVLAIAAARALPEASVFASDDDPVALGVARENAALNRLGSQIAMTLATGLEHPALRQAKPFDLVLANLLPGPLVELAPAMRRAISRRGVAVLSGLLDHQAREVAATYVAAGFHLLRRRQSAGWTALVLEARG
jgi:ribosomal protein L11 methyltransferase